MSFTRVPSTGRPLSYPKNDTQRDITANIHLPQVLLQRPSCVGAGSSGASCHFSYTPPFPGNLYLHTCYHVSPVGNRLVFAFLAVSLTSAQALPTGDPLPRKRVITPEALDEPLRRALANREMLITVLFDIERLLVDVEFASESSAACWHSLLVSDPPWTLLTLREFQQCWVTLIQTVWPHSHLSGNWTVPSITECQRPSSVSVTEACGSRCWVLVSPRKCSRSVHHSSN